MLAHRLVFSLVVLTALAASPTVANAAVQVFTPRTVPAGKVAVARVEAGPGQKVCSLTARSGKTVQGPFRAAAKPVATFTWQVPSLARNASWTLSARCAKRANGLARAKAGQAKVSVAATRSGGVLRLLVPGSVRTVSSRMADFEPSPGGLDCAAPWNGYRSGIDQTGYCTGYDVWYASKRLGHPATFGLGANAASWMKLAPSRGLTVRTTPGPGTIAWWRGTSSEASHVAVVESVGAGSITVAEMNRKRWNVASTRTIRLGTKAAPDRYLALPTGVNIDNGGVSFPVTPGPLPVIQPVPPRGGSRTVEIISTTQSPISRLTTLFTLGYGADNVFRATPLATADNVLGIAGDVDGDGRAELVSLKPWPPSSGTFQYVVARPGADGRVTVTTAPAPERPSATAVLDVNGDGRADIVSFESQGYVVALANGDGTFTRGPATAIPAPGYFGTPVVGDFTGDGRADLLLSIDLLVSNGDGTFTPRPAFDGNAPWPGPIAAGDFDEDGKADAVTLVPPGSDSTPSGYYLSRSNGDGTFAPVERFADTVPQTHQVWPGDVDGDGHVDLVAVEHVAEAREVITRYVAYLGRGDATFTKVVLATGQHVGAATAVGDFDGR
ncbi:CHAP domain-containing protein [Solirubrobacter pauli]|uniref:CHAP domain-containing protein n=1 Tax=Solirubrobacter pauli TaxID=166793 RepID=A0A660LCF0_9ACTN|nr:FG-GAP-like repeat-containing protein [Solirubrobacter pauli]RKQ92046.1 CHAP domain-containing protein [Solirubrobacter pauli]